MKRISLLFTAVATVVCGCSHNTGPADAAATASAIRPGAAIAAVSGNPSPGSRAAIEGTQFPASASGVFSLSAYRGTGVPTDFSSPYFAGQSVNTDATHTPVLAVPQYYPVDGASLSFFAWAPAITPTAGTTTDAPVATYTLTGQEDLLWAADATGIGVSHPQQQPSFTFRHLLKQITFRVIAGEGFPGDVYRVTSIKITGVQTAARLNTVSGTLTFDATPTADLTAYADPTGISIPTAGAGIPGSVMFAPGTTFTISVTAGGTEYDDLTVTLSGTDAGQAGKSHEVTLTFNGSKLIVTSVWMQDWTLADAGTVDVINPLPPTPVRANCAMVTPGDAVAFDVADRIGKAKTADPPVDLTATGTGAWSPGTDYTPLLIWQEAEGLIPTLTYDKSAATLTVTTARVNDPTSGIPGGNAVVGLFPAGTTDPFTANCIWSWHVWVTGYNPDAIVKRLTTVEANHAYPNATANGQVHTYGTQYMTATGNKVIMDRNFGAASALYALATGAGDNWPTYGLHYQWGRKDPFPGAAKNATPNDPGSMTINDATRPLYGISALNSNTLSSADGPATIAGAIKTPQVHYLYPGRDWIYPSIDNLWNSTDGQKSVYDPCPEGWRVPPKETWNDFSETNFIPPSGWTNNELLAGRLYTAGSVQAWYPAQGLRHYSRSGAPSAVCIIGALHSRTGAKEYSFDRYTINTPGSARGSGYPVRCIQE